MSKHSPLEAEIHRAIQQYVQDQDVVLLRGMCAVAGEWYDGADSRMRAFSRNNGFLPTGADYSKLSDETTEALQEIRADDTATREALLAIGRFGSRMRCIDKRLRTIAKEAALLADAGIADQYISGAASLAVAERRSQSDAAVKP